MNRGSREPKKGIQIVTEMLSGLDASHQGRLIRSVAARNPELAEEIRKRLFNFDHLAKLDLEIRQRLFQRIPVEKLALALRALPEAVSAAMFEALTQRTAAEVRDEMLSQGPRRLSEVERARAEIIQLARTLIPGAPSDAPKIP